MNLYIIDDMLFLPGHEAFVALSVDNGGEIFGTSAYCRMSRHVLNDYAKFCEVVQRELGITYRHPRIDDCEPDEQRKAWGELINCHVGSAGQSRTAWRSVFTVGS